MTRTVAFVLPDLRVGGAEVIRVKLANEFRRRGHNCHMVLAGGGGDLKATLSPGIEVHEVNAARARYAPLKLGRVLKSIRADAVLASPYPVSSLALAGLRLCGHEARVVVCDDTILSKSGVVGAGLKGFIHRSIVSATYRRADAVVAVSRGVADDVAALGGLDRTKIEVIYNPAARGTLPPPAPESDPLIQWWGPKGGRLIAVGQLKTVKDYPTLIRAVAAAPDKSLKLLVLGEGSERATIEALVRKLGLRDRVRLPGQSPDPYVFLQAADALVLSSRIEGFGNVLVEALECGIRVVATDCPTGPREILDNGAFGELAPPSDAPRLAAAIARAIARPADPAKAKRRALDFLMGKIADSYERLLLGPFDHAV